MKEILKEWRVRACIGAVIVLGILPLILPQMGLKFGMDFKGGTLLQLELEKAVNPNTMTTITTILQERLNRYGLADISVTPYGDRYVIVEVAATETGRLEQLKSVLSHQGKFEAVIDGQVVLYSKDLVEIITDPQRGYGYLSSTGQWRVPFVISKEGSERFAKAAKGKCSEVQGVQKCEKIFMFIDRPENATLIMPSSVYENESFMLVNPGNPRSQALPIEEYEKNSLTKIVVADEITPEVVEKVWELATTEDRTRVIYHSRIANISALNVSRGNASLTLVEVEQPTEGYWFWSATGLQSVLSLTPGVTSGEPVTNAVIEGYAPTWEIANKELTEMVVLLQSGKLPVSIRIASTSTVSPTLGEGFLNDILLMGIIAWFSVAFLVFLRYREPKITLMIMMANVAEVLMILGIAALISWEIDIASVAGIIAVVGTGVDQFIIMTDEIKMRGVFEESLVEKIRKAFRIIMGSAATMVAAMFPLLTLGLGLLKGFAITTLIGLFVGVAIVRPAFAKAIEKMFK